MASFFTKEDVFDHEDGGPQTLFGKKTKLVDTKQEGGAVGGRFGHTPLPTGDCRAAQVWAPSNHAPRDGGCVPGDATPTNHGGELRSVLCECHWSGGGAVLQ